MCKASSPLRGSLVMRILVVQQLLCNGSHQGVTCSTNRLDAKNPRHNPSTHCTGHAGSQDDSAAEPALRASHGEKAHQTSAVDTVCAAWTSRAVQDRNCRVCEGARTGVGVCEDVQADGAPAVDVAVVDARAEHHLQPCWLTALSGSWCLPGLTPACWVLPRLLQGLDCCHAGDD